MYDLRILSVAVSGPSHSLRPLLEWPSAGGPRSRKSGYNLGPRVPVQLPNTTKPCSCVCFCRSPILSFFT